MFVIMIVLIGGLGDGQRQQANGKASSRRRMANSGK